MLLKTEVKLPLLLDPKTTTATRLTQTFPKAIKATAQNLADFKFYIQHGAAAYCNSDTPAGEKITCEGSGCPAVEGDNAKVVASFT